MAPSEMNETEVKTRSTLITAIKWWWLFVVLGLAGGVMGYCLGWFSPRVYEAKSVIGVSVDLTDTGDLSDTDEDRLMQNIVGNCLSLEVLEETTKTAIEQGLVNQNSDLAADLWAERFQYAVTLRARADSPQKAEKLVDIWSQNAYQYLTDSAAHAVQAAQIQKAVDDLTSCFQQSALVSPVSTACDSLSLDDKLEQIDALSTALAEATTASRGVAPGMSFLSPSPITKAQQVSSSLGVLTLAGSLLGLLLAYCLVSLGWLPPSSEGDRAA